MINNIYYSSRNIYGIKIYHYTEEYIILFERKYDFIMTNELLQDAFQMYENLDENNKRNVKFQIYLRCKSIDNKDNCMIWLNLSLKEFIKEFGESKDNCK